MSKQISIPGFITASPPEDWEANDTNVFDGLAFRFTNWKPLSTSGRVLVCEHELTFELPTGWDPRPGQIAALEAKKEELKQEFSKRVAQINQQIAQLQAIEYTPEPA